MGKAVFVAEQGNKIFEKDQRVQRGESYKGVQIEVYYAGSR